MALFLHLLIKMLPLYGTMALGFVFGSRFRDARKTIADLIIFCVSPVVFFTAVADMAFDPVYLWLPFIIWSLASLLGFLALTVSRFFWPSSDKITNLLGLMAGTSNSGYFGVPVILILFPNDPNILGIYMLIVLGGTIYENTVGYYLLARGDFTSKEAVRRVLRLPALYAMAAGIVYSFSFDGVLPPLLEKIASDFKGAYVVLGAIMVGLGLVGTKISALDAKMMSFAFSFKFLLWPVVIGLIILVDQFTIKILSDTLILLLILKSIMPLAANNIAFASQLNIYPEKTGQVVVGSTFFALFYIPFVYMMIQSFFPHLMPN
jgi:hypothetical protein